MTISEPRHTHGTSTAMSFDDVLIAELPRDMRLRLESDGRRFGMLVGLIVFMLVVYADYYVLPSLLSGRREADVLWIDLIRHFVLLLAILNLLVLPSLMKRWNLRRALTYRSQHGKWRWDR